MVCQSKPPLCESLKSIRNILYYLRRLLKLDANSHENDEQHNGHYNSFTVPEFLPGTTSCKVEEVYILIVLWLLIKKRTIHLRLCCSVF